MKVLVTGAAGFIGAALWTALARRGDEVVGIDNLNDYYDVRLKYGRLAEAGFADAPGLVEGGELPCSLYPSCRFLRLDIADAPALEVLFARERFDAVLHLAAQAGVRHSISHPESYVAGNVAGFLHVLEACRHQGVRRLVFASSSSVYGRHDAGPCREDERTDRPLSLYAATKMADELMAYSYAGLYGLSVTGLRFFTVYGPWGRPDMSPMRFADAISRGEVITLYNGGDMLRDFTYIEDIVQGTLLLLDRRQPAGADGVRYEIYNIGGAHPVSVNEFVAVLEQTMGTVARKESLPMQPGDMPATFADVSRLERATGYRPRIGLEEGLGRFVAWYQSDKNPLRV